MDAKQLLTAMADLFEKSPERFSPGGVSARDVSGNIVDSLAPDAFSFNVVGFLPRAQAEGLMSTDEFDRSIGLMLDACRLRSGGIDIDALDALGREAVIATTRIAAQ